MNTVKLTIKNENILIKLNNLKSTFGQNGIISFSVLNPDFKKTIESLSLNRKTITTLPFINKLNLKNNKKELSFPIITKNINFSDHTLVNKTFFNADTVLFKIDTDTITLKLNTIIPICFILNKNDFFNKQTISVVSFIIDSTIYSTKILDVV